MVIDYNSIRIFNAKVEKQEGCWSWKGCLDSDGYTVLFFARKSHKGHRVSWSIINGPIPEHLCVLHKCDNRKCTNPEHLFLGTPKDNYHDMIKKGRRVAAKGAKHSRAKLNDDKVREIRTLLKQGLSHRAIAKKYSVDHKVIYDIKTRKTWKYVLDC